MVDWFKSSYSHRSPIWSNYGTESITRGSIIPSKKALSNVKPSWLGRWNLNEMDESVMKLFGWKWIIKNPSWKRIMSGFLKKFLWWELSKLFIWWINREFGKTISRPSLNLKGEFCHRITLYKSGIVWVDLSSIWQLGCLSPPLGQIIKFQVENDFFPRYKGMFKESLLFTRCHDQNNDRWNYVMVKCRWK